MTQKLGRLAGKSALITAAGQGIGRASVEMFACGPEPMLEAAASLAGRFSIPCQLCLEEYMACAVGGCAGCAVPVYQDGAMAMKRVCVDGPVFSAKSIYPDQ